MSGIEEKPAKIKVAAPTLTRGDVFVKFVENSGGQAIVEGATLKVRGKSDFDINLNSGDEFLKLTLSQMGYGDLSALESALEAFDLNQK